MNDTPPMTYEEWMDRVNTRIIPVEPGVTPLIGTNGYLFKCPECEDELEGLTFDAANGYARGHARNIHRRAPF